MDIPGSGAIFTLGRSHLAENAQSYFFIKNDPVKRLTTGASQSAVICESGRLFVWGDNQCGQLGTGDIKSNDTVIKPTCVKTLKALGLKASDIAFGTGWSVILTQTNEIYFSGRNIFHSTMKISSKFSPVNVGGGELVSVSWKPFRVEEFDGLLEDNKEEAFEKVSAGDDHFVVLTSSGRLFGWGSNNQKQLGLQESRLEDPVEVSIDGRIRDVKCGPHSTLLLTENNQLFLAGQMNEFKFPIFTELILTMQFDKIMFLNISKTNEIFMITESGNIYKSSESLRNKSLVFQKFYDYDNEENGPAVKLLKGNLFFAAITRNKKFFTTFSESGHHLKTFRELSKFKNLQILDLAVGDKHVLVFGKPKSTKSGDGSKILNKTYTTSATSLLNGNVKRILNVENEDRNNSSSDAVDEDVNGNFDSTARIFETENSSEGDEAQNNIANTKDNNQAHAESVKNSTYHLFDNLNSTERVILESDLSSETASKLHSPESQEDTVLHTTGNKVELEMLSEIKDERPAENEENSEVGTSTKSTKQEETELKNSINADSKNLINDSNIKKETENVKGNSETNAILSVTNSNALTDLNPLNNATNSSTVNGNMDSDENLQQPSIQNDTNLMNIEILKETNPKIDPESKKNQNSISNTNDDIDEHDNDKNLSSTSNGNHTPGHKANLLSSVQEVEEMQSTQGLSKSPKGSVHSIKFDEKSVKSEKSQERLIRPRTPYPEASFGTPQTVIRVPFPPTHDEGEDDDDGSSSFLKDSLERTPPSRRPSLKYCDRGLKKEQVDEIERKISAKSPRIVEKYFDMDDYVKEDERLIVEINAPDDILDKTLVNEIRFINNGIDVTDKVTENVQKDNLPDLERTFSPDDIESSTLKIKDATENDQKETISKMELRVKTMEDDERTTASINSNISGIESENISEGGREGKDDHRANADDAQVHQTMMESGTKRVKQFITDIKKKGKEISCKNPRSVQVDDEPPAYSSMEENINNKTSRVCTIL